jgi:hypothetical protein
MLSAPELAVLRRKLHADPAPFGPLPPRSDGKGKLRYDRLVAELRAYEAEALGGLGDTIAALERLQQGKGTHNERRRRRQRQRQRRDPDRP